jgi:site-specific recombinase XerD
MTIHEVKKSLHEAGHPALRSHDVCHSSATIPISMGVSSKVVQERLGLSTINIALGVYGHVILIEASRCHAEMR